MKEADTVSCVSPEDRGTSITKGHGLLAGVAAFVAGAAISGASHFTGTAKALEEEGISRAQRLKALPTAGKALAVASGMTLLMGGAVYAIVTQTGVMQIKNSAEVSSLHGAISLAENQRALVKEQFQKRISSWSNVEESQM